MHIRTKDKTKLVGNKTIYSIERAHMGGIVYTLNKIRKEQLINIGIYDTKDDAIKALDEIHAEIHLKKNVLQLTK